MKSLHTARYLEALWPSQPVLDLGCGRGELLSVLQELGAEATGVDNDPAMVAVARERGVRVLHADAVAHVRSLQPGSVGSVVAIQVLEHLGPAAVAELLELSVSRLRPGGVFVAETPNPASLIVLGNSYLLDPTRVQPPLHPALLTFLFESAGFSDVSLEFHSPADDNRLRLVDDPEAPPWADQVNQALAHLNRVLFGPQDYSVVATRPPDG